MPLSDFRSAELRRDPEPIGARRALILIAVLTLLKLLVSERLDLLSNEAYHWLYGRHPAAGYFNHPPMIGWLLAISTAIFGESPSGVRFLSIACGSLALWFVYLAGKRLYDEPAGFFAMVLVGLVPELFEWGSLAYPDAPLLLFWSGSLWALSHALGGDSPRWWLAAGLFFGLALLSKYHAVFIGAGVLLFLALTPDQRRWLRRPEPYVATLLALLVFSPVLFWNASHGWKSLRYQAISRFDGPSLPPRLIHLFPLTELAHLTPVIALWAWGSGLGVVARWRRCSWRDRLAASLSMPLLLSFVAFSFLTRVRGHWTVAAYPGALVLGAAVVLRGGPWGRRLHQISVVLLSLGYLALPIVLWTVPTVWLTGWSQLAEEVRKRSPDFVLSSNYHVASQMAYHLRPIAASDFTAVGKPGNSFEDWWEPSAFQGRDAVVVLPASGFEEERALLSRFFDRISEPETVRVVRFWGKEEEFVLVRAHRYRSPP